MIEYNVLANREDYAQVEEEERNEFFRKIICDIGIDLEEIWPEGEKLDTDIRIKFSELLLKFKLEIIKEGREYRIYYEDGLIAEWLQPSVVLKKDARAKTISKALYYEITFRYNSVFEDDNEEDI